MTQYTVHLSQVIGITMTIDVDDIGDEFDIQDLIDQAIDEAPHSLCARCAGYGRGEWSRDDSGELQADQVDDNDGGQVIYTAPEEWRRVPTGG